jgi:hypothetical protein
VLKDHVRRESLVLFGITGGDQRFFGISVIARDSSERLIGRRYHDGGTKNTMSSGVSIQENFVGIFYFVVADGDEGRLTGTCSLIQTNVFFLIIPSVHFTKWDDKV